MTSMTEQAISWSCMTSQHSDCRETSASCGCWHHLADEEGEYDLCQYVYNDIGVRCGIYRTFHPRAGEGLSHDFIKGGERVVKESAPDVIRCESCGLAYYQTSAPHVCAEWAGASIKEDRMRFEPKVIPCTVCASPTRTLGTKLCDRCWGLKTRIEADPDIAQRILSQSRTEHDQYHSLLAERERLREALRSSLRIVAAIANEQRTLSPEEARAIWIEGAEALGCKSSTALNDQKGVPSTDQKGGEG